MPDAKHATGDASGDATGAEYLARVCALAPAIRRSADDVERLGDLPGELRTALMKAGLFRMLLPKHLDGGEISPPLLAQIMEELARNDASVAWCLGQTSVCATIAAYLPPQVARDVFGPQDGILAWGPGSGQAVIVNGGYRLSGRFHFASGSRLANWLGAHVPVVGQDGSKPLGADGQPLIRTLLFPKSSARIEDTWHVMGLRGTGSDSYVVENLFVPETHAVTRDIAELPRTAGKLYAFTQSTLYASAFAGIALGIARAMLTAFIELAGAKVPRGAKRMLKDSNVIQARVGKCEARLRAGRMYLLGTLGQIWDTRRQGERLTVDDQVAIRLATTWTIQQSREVACSIYNAAGATAIFNTQPFERRFRDMHCVTQQIQSHEAHFETVGVLLLGGEPDRKMFTF